VYFGIFHGGKSSNRVCCQIILDEVSKSIILHFILNGYGKFACSYQRL
jgi:hypothetical protein